MAESIPPRRGKTEAPTPNNTPAAGNAPISSRAQAPGLGSLKEEDLDKAAAASILAQNPKIVSMIQGRLSGLVGKSSGYVESLPESVQRRVTGLKGVQTEHAKLEQQFQEEVLELEKKFFAKFTPLYQKRASIIAGKAEPSDAEVAAGEKRDKENVDSDDDDDDAAKIKAEPQEDDPNNPMKGIPEFWLSAMKNHPSLAELITEDDEGALKHMTDIRMEYLDQLGFRLIFEFEDNDYFTNKAITKSYFYQEEKGYGAEFVYDHAEGDKIDWKTGKDLTVRIESKKQRNKNTKQTRIVKKTVPTESFFNFFSPPKPPTDEDDDAASDIEERLELDYSLGEDIKEKLIPHGIDWFTGEALHFEQLGDDFDEGEFEDEDDEDEDDLSDDDPDDDDDSDEEIDGPRSAKADTQECKQS